MLLTLIFLSALLSVNPVILLEAGEKLNPSHKNMVFIPPGTYLMGSDNNQGYQTCLDYNKTCKKKWFLDEHPAHTVKLDGFHIDIYEITQEEFDRVMGKTPSEYKGSNRPVDNVTWFEAREYCK